MVAVLAALFVLSALLYAASPALFHSDEASLETPRVPLPAGPRKYN